MDNDFKFIASTHLSGKWGSIISQHLIFSGILVLFSLVCVFINKIFLILFLFLSPCLTFGFYNVLYKIIE